MKKFKIGVQLYSVRDDMEKDMDSTLRRVSEMGYDCVEFAGYFGKSADEVKAMLDKYGLEAISVHQGYDVFLQDEKANIDYLKVLGVKYCAIPWLDKEKHAGGEAFPQTVRDITQVAKALKANGIQLCYHNHDFEFEKYEGKTLMDRLLESVPELQPEFDLGWVEIAGIKPSECLGEYVGRCEIVHLKDFKKTNGNAEFTLLGKGIQDFKTMLSSAEAAGVEYLIVENEAAVNVPMDAIKSDREFLKALGL